MTNNRYTDEALHERATAPNAMPGSIAEFRILTQVPLEVREQIVSEAHTMGNYQGGRWSSCLQQAVDTYLRAPAFSPDLGFPFQARAKAHRDAEAKVNEGNFGPRIILPMN